MWEVTNIRLSPRARGFHLISSDVVAALTCLGEVDRGSLHLFLQHTSASLSLNENADPSVRLDMESHFNVLAPENAPYYQHLFEGADDMPAHIKAALIGCDVTIPIHGGKLCLGTWQGIYLGEHRDNGGSRTLVATVQGQRKGE